MTLKSTGLVPELPSSTEVATALIETTGATSSLLMITSACLAVVDKTSPDEGADRATVNCSFASTSVSPATSTCTVFVISPGLKVKVPVKAPLKSFAVAALVPEPAALHTTLCAVVAALSSVTLKSTGLVPELPSSTEVATALMETMGLAVGAAEKSARPFTVPSANWNFSTPR